MFAALRSLSHRGKLTLTRPPPRSTDHATAVFWAVFYPQSCDCNVKPLTGKQRRTTLSAANECCVCEEQHKLLRAQSGRTDGSPVTNKQRRHGKSPPNSAERRYGCLCDALLCAFVCGNCALFGPLVRVLESCNCHGEVKRDAFVTSPIPLCVSFRVDVCGVRAPACVRVRFSRASKWQPRGTRGRGWSPAVRACFAAPLAAEAAGRAPAARLRGHFRMFYSRDASGFVTRCVHLKVYFQNNRKSHYGSGSSTCLSISSGAVLCCKLASVRLHSACSCGQSLKFIIIVDHSLPSDVKIQDCFCCVSLSGSRSKVRWRWARAAFRVPQ